MSRGTALALSAMMGMWRCWGRRADFHGFHPADAGQVDVHQDHIGLVDPGKLDAHAGVGCAQQMQVGAARHDQLSPVPGWPGCLPHTARCALACPRDRRCAARPAGRASLATRLRCGGERHFDPEHTAHAGRAVHTDQTTHEFYQPLGHHQANARALFPASLLPSRLNGWNSWPSCSWSQAGAGVAHADAHRLRRSACRSTVTWPPVWLYLMALNSRLISTCFSACGRP
jgi:hypothetical protein